MQVSESARTMGDITRAEIQMAKLLHTQFFLLLLVVATNSSRVSRSDGHAASCTNPSGQAGTCLNIKQCPSLLNLLRQQREIPGVADFLRASACGYEGRDPKVCCPGVATGTTGPPPENNTSAPVTEYVRLPDLSECGIVGPAVEDRRVVGGYPAELGAWPWIVALGYKSSPSADVKFLCGSALITHKHVITAGHCVHGRRDLYMARLGELDLKDDNDGATPTDILIVDRKVHEEYNPTTFVNDIAILRLQDAVTFTALIRPICLPLAPEIRTRDFVRNFPYIAGWGSVQFNGPSSSHLQQLQIPVVSQAQCRDAFKKFSTAHIDDHVMCAGYAQGGKDACQVGLEFQVCHTAVPWTITNETAATTNTLVYDQIFTG
ncbi:hypothetical protein B7P43_G17518 [Cryptotermes secundus]|uniref:CLIP domain-containing serine protease n=1 Tax=Cryptotermes secundus TaxID=105785 RepID=A0A2J7R088_9NEOP|nr:hypothetical protein B7P43_G17518 [Cryptotermes secundus]